MIHDPNTIIQSLLMLNTTLLKLAYDLATESNELSNYVGSILTSVNDDILPYQKKRMNELMAIIERTAESGKSIADFAPAINVDVLPIAQLIQEYVSAMFTNDRLTPKE